MEAYNYESLSNPDSMRLLSVGPISSPEDVIKCSLEALPMDRSQEYTALSYSWAKEDGDASICKSITIDGKMLAIGQNLFDGLHRIFAGHERQPPIWIDAVCIDQTNVDERSAQVARMCRIYSNAAKVICWLGEGRSRIENDNIAACLACLNHKRHSHFREHRIVLENGGFTYACLSHAAASARKVWYASFQDMRDCIIDLFPNGDLIFSTKEVQHALEAFCSKRYWSRRWIVQEFCKAPAEAVSVQWSNHTIKAQHLPAFFKWGAKHTRLLLGDFRSPIAMDKEAERESQFHLDHCRKLFDLRQGSAGCTGPTRLVDSVTDCWAFNSSDPRDIVYALLGMDPGTGILPNYRSPTTRVFQMFSVDTLERAGLNLPCFLMSVAAQKKHLVVSDDEVSNTLPSWCADLRTYFFWEPYNYGFSRGSWSIDSSGVLTCLAVKVGHLSADLKVIETAMSSEAVKGSRVSNPCPAHYAVQFMPQPGKSYQGTCNPGDLVCSFEASNDVDDKLRVASGPPDGFKVSAVVLRPLRDDQATCRIVTKIAFETPSYEPFRPSVHLEITLRIR